jgi:hypothetical protein
MASEKSNDSNAESPDYKYAIRAATQGHVQARNWLDTMYTGIDHNTGNEIALEWRDYKSGEKGETVKIGYANTKGQMCLGHRGKIGTDHNQFAYATKCDKCSNIYGANGSDLHERLCPRCMD